MKKKEYTKVTSWRRNWRRSSGWVSALDCPAERAGGGGRFTVRPQPLRHGGDLYARIRRDREGPASLHLSVSYKMQDNKENKREPRSLSVFYWIFPRQRLK